MSKRSVYLHYTEASVSRRYHKVQGSIVQQEEVLIMVTKSPLTLSGRKRRHFEGTHRGSILGPIQLADYELPYFWKLFAKDKKELFGKTNRVAVGGSSPPEAENPEVDLGDPSPSLEHAS